MSPKATLCLLVLCGSACASTPASETAVAGAVVTWRSVAPPYTGYVRSWVAFKANARETEIELLYPYYDKDETLPVAGDVCDFRYRSQVVDGQVGDRIEPASARNVVSSFDCR